MTAISITIRPARPADAPAIARLGAQLGYDGEREETAARLHSVCGLPGHEVLVAETPHGEVVGWIHVFSAPRVESDGFAEIGGLVVDAHHRRQGIGARLVSAAEEAASRLGFRTVRIRSRIERDSAHTFFENRGFEPVKTQRVYEALVAENMTLNFKE